ncbi:hypothetical protein [Burkholderia cepacia]|uniref:hypothetical protein n=1 Tax=Burkholderia cepacia TaxID=292 RepID=UPI001CF52F08|nr:hypothetical protein [Burkholderia cepacia]MCA8328915.1 hypothetical protein [Burkholderia cepacia]
MADRSAEVERIRRACRLAAAIANVTFGRTRQVSRPAPQENVAKASGQPSDTPSAVFVNCHFSGNGVADIAVSGDYNVELHDTTCQGSAYGILQYDALAMRASSDQRSSNMKITQSGNSKIHGNVAGVSVVENSNAEIELKDEASISGGVYGIEERSALMDRLRATLPAGVPSDVIDDAIAEVEKVKGGSAEEKQAAVQRSRLWEWIKENGGDVAALAVKVANALT